MTDRDYMELRRLLNSWDPIGVADLAPDEYGCLHEPLAEALEEGADEAAIMGLLQDRLEHHFGLNPMVHEVRDVAFKIALWWSGGRE